MAPLDGFIWSPVPQVFDAWAPAGPREGGRPLLIRAYGDQVRKFLLRVMVAGFGANQAEREYEFALTKNGQVLNASENGTFGR
jgi:hypothetical protein